MITQRNSVQTLEREVKPSAPFPFAKAVLEPVFAYAPAASRPFSPTRSMMAATPSARASGVMPIVPASPPGSSRYSLGATGGRCSPSSGVTFAMDSARATASRRASSSNRLTFTSPFCLPKATRTVRLARRSATF